MPASVIADYQGTAAAYQSSQSNEGLLILAALITVYIVLGVLYESFIHPVTILSTLPSAGVGALLALRLFGLDLDIVGIIGIILLIGIVQKNGIMMVDFALELERKEHKETTEAIYQAALLRLRPILMTTLAALLSGIPLAFGTGIGSELRKPLGVAMVGGLLFSQVLTLYTTPVIYIFFDKLAARFSRRRREEARDARAPRAGLHEPVQHFHRAPGSHDPVDDCGRTGGHRRLHGFARVAAAPGGLSDHHGRCLVARRKSGHHGVRNRHTVGETVRTHRRHHGDDLLQHARHHQHHPAIRSQPGHQRRGARRGSRNQRGPQLPASQPPRQSDLSESQSGRLPDHGARTAVRRVRRADAIRRGFVRHCPARLTDLRGRTGERGGCLLSGRARGVESRQAHSLRNQPAVGGERHLGPEFEYRPGATRQRQLDLGHHRQQPDLQGSRLQAAGDRLLQRCGGPPHRRGRRRRLAAERAPGRLPQRPALGKPDHLPPAGCQHHPDRGSHQGGDPLAPGLDPAAACTSSPYWTARSRSVHP